MIASLATRTSCLRKIGCRIKPCSRSLDSFASLSMQGVSAVPTYKAQLLLVLWMLALSNNSPLHL